MRRPLPCVPAQAVVHWRLEVKTPEFQETRQACSSPWIKGETGKGTQSGLNCSSVEKDLFLMHTVPNSPHCYLKRNTSGLGKHAEDEWLCSVTVTWGPQSQVLWEEGSGTTAENTPVHIAREGDCRRGGWNVNRCPLQTNLKVTSSKAQCKKMLLFGQRDYKKTPLPARARTWFSWKSLSWVPALSPLNGVSFRVCNTQTAWWDPKAPLGWEFPWRQ